MLGIELEPTSLWKVGGVENSVPPVRIVVPARSYEKTCFRSRGRGSELFGVQEHLANDGMNIELLGTESSETKTLSHALWET